MVIDCLESTPAPQPRDRRAGGRLNGERQQTMGSHKVSFNMKRRQQRASVSISHPLLLFFPSHSLKTPRPFHLLAHFYPSRNHRDHCCLKRGQTWWCQMRMLDVCVYTHTKKCTREHTNFFTALPLNKLYKLFSLAVDMYFRTDAENKTGCGRQSEHF